MSTQHADTSDSLYTSLVAMAKVGIAWLGIVFGNMTTILQNVAILLTIIYTAVQIYILVRDKILRDKAPKE